MAPIDPHSFTDSSHPLTTHIALELLLDFDKKVILGTGIYTLSRAHSGNLFLDTRQVHVGSAADSHGKPLKFTIPEQPDAIKGSLLQIELSNDNVFSLSFKTAPNASSALQWLEPSQTSGGNIPYVFTQCQAIHARSIFPCQDTPAARFRYSARLDIPCEMRAVMSAGHVDRLTHEQHPDKVLEGRAVEVFNMEQPIPPYLFALAVGDISFRDLGPRSRVYAEPNVLEAAAYEFANTERMIEQAEALFGPYDWERFDLLVMPPSFPYGGMENPRMVFLTPTVIVGDRSGVEVVAHELAHSWTGNLITNSSANDFWLNEGFTTYAERRIVEVLDGEERVALHLGLGWNGLEDEIQRFKDRPQFTRLKTNQENVDPDEIYSQVPYEKGCLFVRRLESHMGRPLFDKFLKSYIATFRFQSIDTETFLDFLQAQFPDIGKQLDLQTWIYGEGIPPDAMKPKSRILDSVLATVDSFRSACEKFEADEWQRFLKSMEEDCRGWQAQEWQLFLESVPKKVHPEALKQFEEVFRLSESKNWEMRIGFLVIAAYSGYEACFADVERALLSVGRMKFLRPLYSGLLESSPQGQALAKEVFVKAKSKYHPIAQSVVEGLMKKHGVV